jgi:hypothetical protein
MDGWMEDAHSLLNCYFYLKSEYKYGLRIYDFKLGKEELTVRSRNMRFLGNKVMTCSRCAV